MRLSINARKTLVFSVLLFNLCGIAWAESLTQTIKSCGMYTGIMDVYELHASLWFIPIVLIEALVLWVILKRRYDAKTGISSLLLVSLVVNVVSTLIEHIPLILMYALIKITGMGGVLGTIIVLVPFIQELAGLIAIIMATPEIITGLVYYSYLFVGPELSLKIEPLWFNYLHLVITLAVAYLFTVAIETLVLKHLINKRIKNKAIIEKTKHAYVKLSLFANAFSHILLLLVLLYTYHPPDFAAQNYHLSDSTTFEFSDRDTDYNCNGTFYTVLSNRYNEPVYVDHVTVVETISGETCETAYNETEASDIRRGESLHIKALCPKKNEGDPCRMLITMEYLTKKGNTFTKHTDKVTITPINGAMW